MSAASELLVTGLTLILCGSICAAIANAADTIARAIRERDR